LPTSVLMLFAGQGTGGRTDYRTDKAASICFTLWVA